MPLPLPIMIPFMMWQSAAIAAGFGTYFQFAKRRVSAMSNEEFNNANPHDLVSQMYDEMLVHMPSSFKKIETLTPVILDSMLKMLTDAADWFAGILGGTGLTELQRRLAGGDPLNPLLPQENIGDDGRQTSHFVPDVQGQASIPSVAWLNKLNRDQLKAIRNDALRGDYNKDSTALILARYKEVFDFDKDASLPNQPDNIGKIQIKPVIKIPPSSNIQPVEMVRLNAEPTVKAMLIKAGKRYAAAIVTRDRARSKGAKEFFQRAVDGWVKILKELENFINKNL